MIWESSYWKDDLLRDARIIIRCATKRPSERQSILLEKKIMIAAYSIRKLMEGKKTSTRMAEFVLDCESFKRTKKRMTLINWHKVEYLFDLTQASPKRIRVADLCNQIIHSYIFLFDMNDNCRSYGFFVSSDRSKDRELLYIKLASFVKLMRWVGRDNPPSTVWWTDQVSGEERVVLGSEEEIREAFEQATATGRARK